MHEAILTPPMLAAVAPVPMAPCDEHGAEAAAPVEALMRLARSGRLREALLAGRAQWAEAREAGSVTPALAMALAWFAFQLGVAEEGLDYVFAALEAAAEAGDRAREAQAHALHAWLLLDLGHGEPCAEQALLALDMAEAEGEPLALSWALLTMAIVFWYLKQPDRALPYAERAIAVARPLGDPILIGWWLVNLGGVHGEFGEQAAARGDAVAAAAAFSRAIGLTEEALELLLPANEVWGSTLGLLNLAQFELLRGRPEAALAPLGRAEALPECGERARVQRLDLLGQVLLAEDRPADAIAVLGEAAAIATRLSNWEALHFAWLHLSQAHERLGAYDLALAYHKRFHETYARVCTDAVQSRARIAEVLAETRKLREGMEAATRRSWEMAQSYEALRREARDLAAEALRDPLTGLGNRRLLHQTLAALSGHGRSFAIAMIDIDFFKSINDRYTHCFGDRVLQEVGRVLQANSRTADVAARFGGEEFALLLIGLDREQAERVCARVRRAVRGLVWPDVPQAPRVTVSIGLAFGDEADDPDGVLGCADARLYAAKSGGRDRLVAA